MALKVERKMAELYDELHNRGYEPYALDRTGKKTLDPEKALTIGFTLRDENGVKSDPAYISMDKKPRKDIITSTIWVDGEVIRSPEFQTFHKFIKPWVLNKIGDFEIRKSDHFQFDMQKRAKHKMQQEKDTIAEGYYPLGKKTSYSDNVPTVKIIIEHNRAIEEGEQRFRNVHRIFVENMSGERFLLPTARPGLARVYARHIAEGGTPYDDKAKHITTLVEEYTKMAGFVRATKNGQFNESTQRLINEGLNHYSSLRETLTRLTTHRGYTKYFESYTPVLNEETDDTENLNELFVQETLDPRIESVMPILKRLSKNLQEMNEVNELAEWSQQILEGGDGGEASEETDGDTPGDAGEGGAEDVSENIDKKKIANSQEVASVIAKSFGGEKGLTSDDIYSAIDEYKELLAEKGYDVNEDKVAQILMDKLNIQLDEKMDSTTASLAVSADDMLDEAPGAETLAHNQSTEKSNLKAFDLDEGFSPSEEVADMIIQSMGGVGKLTSDDIYRVIDEYQYHIMDNPERLDADEVAQTIFDKLHGKGIMVPDIAEGSGDAPIELMTDKELADYLGVSVSFVRQDRKRAEQAARDKTDDVTEAEDDADLSNKNMAQQTAYMQKNQMPNDIAVPADQFKDNPEAAKLMKSAQNKDGTYSFSRGMGRAVDTIMPVASDFGRTVGKFYYRDAPGMTQKFQKQDPEGFKKAYDAGTDADRAEMDKNLAITPAQAKANYKQYQGDLDKQMTDQGYSKYGYNYNTQPVVGRIKNAGAWVKDKFNEEEIEEDLDANQKRVGQLGPTEKVKNNNIGKLVGASESVEMDRLKALSGIK